MRQWQWWLYGPISPSAVSLLFLYQYFYIRALRDPITISKSDGKTQGAAAHCLGCCALPLGSDLNKWKHLVRALKRESLERELLAVQPKTLGEAVCVCVWGREREAASERASEPARERSCCANTSLGKLPVLLDTTECITHKKCTRALMAFDSSSSRGGGDTIVWAFWYYPSIK